MKLRGQVLVIVVAAQPDALPRAAAPVIER
jgi:hypothetical protein